MATERQRTVTIKPALWLFGLPYPLIFIIYRVLPTVLFASSIYALTLTESWKIYRLFNSGPFAYLSCVPLCGPLTGLMMGKNLESKYPIEGAPSREERAKNLREILESYESHRAKYPFGLINVIPRTERRMKMDIQRQKEGFALFLSGSWQSLSPIYSAYTLLLLVPWGVLVGCRIVAAMIPAGEIAFRRFGKEDVPVIILFILGHLLFFFFLVQCGKEYCWYIQLYHPYHDIKKGCKSLDTEKGGDIQKELAWWIEAALTEETDSAKMAEERERVIINPILERIKS